MTHPFLSPDDAPERQVEKLSRIADALMRRVEQATDEGGAGYAHFQQAVMLESQVRARTRDLERTLRLLNESNAGLATANETAQQARADLYNALEAVQEGFALFGADDALVMCNSRFCRQMPNVWPELGEGVTFDEYVRLLADRGGIDFKEVGGPEAWARRRLNLHGEDQVMFNVRLRSGEWLQVSEYRTPAGGTAILQTDITDLIRIERAERDKLLDDQATLMRATLDHISQGVCLFDREARLVAWNRRLGDLLTPPMRMVRVGASFDALFNHFERGATLTGGIDGAAVRSWVAKGRGRAPLHFDMRRPGGAILSVFAQETPDRGFVVSFTDVTAERQAAAALHEANSMLERRVSERTQALEVALKDAERANASKSRFVAAASHDLLQPLSAAKLFISSLKAMDLAERPMDVARRAENALGAVEGMLGALLDISRLDSGRADLKSGPVHLGRLLAQLEEEFGPVAAAKGLSLRIRPSRVVAESDQAYLRRILQNLISNAIRYTDRGGVLVGVRRAGDGVRVEVWDTGRGVPDHQHEEIFKEFQRLGAAGNAGEGMGLGLAIVERAATLLGHDLELRSRVGRGSCFALTLGIAAGAAAPAEPCGGPPARSVGSDLLVLIVENDPEMSAALATQLEAWGLSAFEARSGAGAAALLAETGVTPDILLIDYALDGGETGFDAIRLLRSRCGRLPTALVTATPAVELREEAYKLGVRVVPKPIENAELLDFLARGA